MIPRWQIWATAVGLFVIAFVLVVVAQRDQGIARDEVTYMNVGSRYADWWLDPDTSDKGIKDIWGGAPGGGNNTEHPPLMKTLFGLSEKVFHDKLGWTSELTGYRLPTALLNALLVALVFGFTCAVWGYAEGVVAALLTLLLPRAFYHAGLACFDAPIAALWFATIVAYWKSLASKWWLIGVGLVFGCALATKHNAIILPVVVIAHYPLIAYRTKQPPWSLGAMLLVGPLVLYALWPWLWDAPIAHAKQWLSFHFDHTHYNYEYLGENWNAPPFPWHVAIVTTLFTVPVATLAAAAVGAGVLIRRAWKREEVDGDRAPGVLLFLSAGGSMGPFLLGSTPIFGAEKHWAPAIPTICIFAGVGLVWAARRVAVQLAPKLRTVTARALHGAAIALVGGAAVLASAAETAASHPYGLSHYNALAGGAPGGADLGMNRQFWGTAAKGVIPWIARQPAGKTYSHDASPAWAGPYRRWHLVDGHFDSGNERRWDKTGVCNAGPGGIENSDYAMVIHELHFNRHDYFVWDAYGTVQPAYVLRTDGVPIVTVYRRP